MISFTIGGITLHAYGLAVALAAAAALGLAAWQFSKRNLPAGTLSWFALLCVPLSLLTARLGYCLARYGWFMQKGALWFFRLDQGGYILYGALLGGLFALLLTARISRTAAVDLADALAAPAALMIALCRLAEGLADEGWGWDLDTWFSADGGMRFSTMEKDLESWAFFPLAHYREKWDTWYWAIYVLEALIALAICLYLIRRCRSLRPGDGAVTLVLMYAVSQLLCESMRQDSLLRWGFVRVMQVIGAAVIVAVQLYWTLRPGHPAGKKPVLRFVGTVVCFLFVIAMEFGVEKKIVPLEWFPVIGCHLVMLLACAGMLACILPLRGMAEQKGTANA